MAANFYSSHLYFLLQVKKKRKKNQMYKKMKIYRGNESDYVEYLNHDKEEIEEIFPVTHPLFFCVSKLSNRQQPFPLLHTKTL